jgi:hypothetical protein
MPRLKLVLRGYPSSRQIQRQDFRVGEMACPNRPLRAQGHASATESASGRLASLSGMKPFHREPFWSPALQRASESALRERSNDHFSSGA